MPSIKEAYDELAHRWEPLPMSDGEDLLRALAVAVFWDCYAAHYPCTREHLCGPHADRLTRIGHLGT